MFLASSGGPGRFSYWRGMGHTASDKPSSLAHALRRPGQARRESNGAAWLRDGEADAAVAREDDSTGHFYAAPAKLAYGLRSVWSSRLAWGHMPARTPLISTTCLSPSCVRYLGLSVSRSPAPGEHREAMFGPSLAAAGAPWSLVACACCRASSGGTTPPGGTCQPSGCTQGRVSGGPYRFGVLRWGKTKGGPSAAEVLLNCCAHCPDTASGVLDRSLPVPTASGF